MRVATRLAELWTLLERELPWNGRRSAPSLQRFDRKGIPGMGEGTLDFAELRSGRGAAGFAARDPLWTRLADGDHPRGTRSGPAAPTRTALDGAELPRSGRSPWVFAGRQLAKTTNPANTASRHPADAPARISSGTPIAPARRPRRDGTPAPAPAAIWAFPPPSPWPRPRPAAPAAEAEPRTRGDAIPGFGLHLCLWTTGVSYPQNTCSTVDNSIKTVDNLWITQRSRPLCQVALPTGMSEPSDTWWRV